MSAPLPGFGEIWAARKIADPEEVISESNAEDRIAAITGADSLASIGEVSEQRNASPRQSFLGRLAAAGRSEQFAAALRQQL